MIIILVTIKIQVANNNNDEFFKNYFFLLVVFPCHHI